MRSFKRGYDSVFTAGLKLVFEQALMNLEGSIVEDT